MRIISEYKDYYDWVVFETDNRKIFNRTYSSIEYPEKYISSWDKSAKYFGTLYFCNKEYKFLHFNGNYYWNNDSVPDDVVKAINKEINSFRKDNKWFALGLQISSKTKEPYLHDKNLKLGCPIILSYDDRKVNYFNPKLVDINFNKVVTPIEAYQEIYNWIPYIEPKLPGPPEDMSRYEAKGFDKKTSFRPKMKEK